MDFRWLLWISVYALVNTAEVPDVILNPDWHWPHARSDVSVAIQAALCGKIPPNSPVDDKVLGTASSTVVLNSLFLRKLLGIEDQKWIGIN